MKSIAAHPRWKFTGTHYAAILCWLMAGKPCAAQPTNVVNGDFEQAAGNRFAGWTMQDDEGVVSFADHNVVHGGKTSVRMENIGRNEAHHCRLSQPLKLQPYRQYLISFRVKTEGLSPADAEVKV